MQTFTGQEKGTMAFPADTTSPGTSLCSLYGPWVKERHLVEHFAQLGPALHECAAHVASGSVENACRCLAQITNIASVDGPLQRLAVIMADGLVRRLLRPIHGINEALMDPSDYFDWRSVRAARGSFFDLSPFLKAAFVAGNRAILEAMENEQNVHVIDFCGPAAQPCQWINLLREFHRRPERPPGLRITVVHDDKDFLAKTKAMLSAEAEALDMSFRFHDVVITQLEAMDFDNLHSLLEIKSGEARAVICTLQLHRLLAVDDIVNNFGTAHFKQMASIAQLQKIIASSSSCPSNNAVQQYKDDQMHSPASTLTFFSPQTSTPQWQTPKLLMTFLSAVRALSPKIMVVTEQDANHNGLSFRKRFNEALNYYAALFDSMDAAAAVCRMPRERAQVERILIGEEIKNVLLCEGVHRHERHDRLHNWGMRMELAGFGNVPFSYIAIKEANEMLRRCGIRSCGNKEHRGCLLLCWSSRPLYSISVWRPNRGSTFWSRDQMLMTE